MPTVELKRLVGQFREAATGKVRSGAWNGIERVFLNGRQIATINKVPGSPVGLLAGTMLTPAEVEAVSNAIAAQRGGVKPSRIGGPREELFELLDDAVEMDNEGDDTETDDSDE
jgi:hypothetical protein